jgi:hypothetical protein
MPDLESDDFAWLRVEASYRTLYPQLYRLAVAIRRHEGWHPKSLSWRNKNPGNLRASPFMATNDGGFAVFESAHQGMVALLWDLEAKCSGRTATRLDGKSTLVDLFEVYAPSGDDNDPAAYADAVAGELSVGTDYKLERFLETY